MADEQNQMIREQDQLADDQIRLADMSLLDQGSVFSRWFGQRPAGQRRTLGASQMPAQAHPPASLLEGRERRTAIRGALAASLLIGVIYVAAAGIFILLLLWLWGAL